MASVNVRNGASPGFLLLPRHQQLGNGGHFTADDREQEQIKECSAIEVSLTKCAFSLIACSESRVHVVDVSDPASPRGVTTLPETSESNGVVIDSNNVLAAACYSRGIRVFDATDSGARTMSPSSRMDAKL